MVMAFSTDTDLTDIQPDILSLGIDDFSAEHAKAEADIKREIRAKYWSRTGRAGEMDATLLTDSQFTKANAYLVLWKYALPQLTNWVDGDRFQSMISFYRDMYNQEMAAIFADGIEYDFNDDGTVEDTEKDLFIQSRLTR
jgi:hypothetical protein